MKVKKMKPCPKCLNKKWKLSLTPVYDNSFANSVIRIICTNCGFQTSPSYVADSPDYFDKKSEVKDAKVS